MPTGDKKVLPIIHNLVRLYFLLKFKFDTVGYSMLPTVPCNIILDSIVGIFFSVPQNQRQNVAEV